MSLITFDSSTGVLPDTYLTLSVSAIADTLVLAEFQDSPYNLVREGFDASDNRSLTGSIRVKGNTYTPPHKWHLAFIVNRIQASLFETMLLAQKAGQQIVLFDRFGASTMTNVWIDVDDRYLTEQAPDWLLLQFTAKEEI
jgi:hypothetical protein